MASPALQLRVYATHQGPISGKLSSEDIAFVLNENLLPSTEFNNFTSLISGYMSPWGINITVVIGIILFSLYHSKGADNITNVIDTQIDVIIPAVLIGMLIIAVELVVTGMISSSVVHTLSYIYIVIWLLMTVLFLIVFFSHYI